MRIKKILLYFFLVLVLLLSAIFVVGKFYNDQVKDFVVSKLNEGLTAKVKVGEVDLTLFDNFPQAAIRFSQVTIADKLSPQGRDTMLYADKMYLSFNFWDIWNKNYKITELSIHGGMCHVAQNEKGENNFDIWKSDTSGKANTDFQIMLKSVKLDNIYFRYTQPTNQQELKCFIKTANLSGNLTDKEFSLETAVNARMYGYTINGINYIQDKNVSIETELAVNTEQQDIGFKNVKLSVNQVELGLDGMVNYGDKSRIDLKITGREIKILDLIASLPEFSTEKLERYKADGFLTINSRLYGSIGNEILPSFSANFSISKGSMEETSSKVVLNELQLKGYYFSGFSGTDDSLSLTTLSGKFNSGNFSVSGSMANFSQPNVNAKIQGNIDLFQLTRFFGLVQNDTIEGQLIINAAIRGVLTKSDTSSHQVWNKLNTQGEIALKQGRFRLRGAKNPLENVQGKVKLSENLALLEQFSFSSGSSDFLLTGVIHNLVPYVFKNNEVISVAANLNSNRIDLADFIATKENDKSGKDFRLNFPKDIKGYLTTNIGNLKYHHFSADKVGVRLVLSSDGLTAESISMKAFKGSVSGSLSVKREANGYVLQNETNLDRVELDQFFYQLDNFGQGILTNKEIKGKADAKVRLTARLNASLEFDLASIQSTAQIKVTDGQLNNLELLKDLAGYLKSNKTIAAVVNTDKLGERLKSVSFATLENTVTIKDQKIIIPEMNIKSSALDLNINGTHSFDNKIDYGLNFRMAEVFQKDKVTDNGYIVDDNTGMRMFIAISGTTDNPVFKYDKLSAAKARTERFQQEKTTFKSLLKQEFGLFGSDTTLKKVVMPDKGKVRFELETEAKPGATNNPAKPTQKPAVKPKKPVKQEEDTKDYLLDDDI